MKISKDIGLKRRLLSTRLREASAKLWASPAIIEIYPTMLFRIHCMARASVPLMEAAVERLRPRVGTDPIAGPLIEYLTAQIPQETGHDDWLLEDLEALGEDRKDVLARMPPPTIAALIGAQYYWIRHHHPVALLGYILVVESEPPTTELVDKTVRDTGLPRAAFRSFSRHALLEPSHNDALDRALDSLPLTGTHLGLIGVSIIQTANMIADAAEEILNDHVARAHTGLRLAMADGGMVSPAQ